MAKRPGGLIYRVDEKPSAFELAVLAVQHIFLMSSTLVLPVVLVTEIGGGFDQVRAVVALTMIACGLGTIVQAMRWHGIGSGFLCPNLWAARNARHDARRSVSPVGAIPHQAERRC